MAHTNIRTAQVVTGAGTWHELADITTMFGIAPNAVVVQFCVGHGTPSTALSVTIPIGASFELATAPTGPVHVMTAAIGRVDWYGA